MSYQDIHVSEVEQLLELEGLVIIDHRDPQARARGQLPNALPSSDAVMHSIMRRRRSNPPVLVYCYHGNSSRDLCSLLSQLGLSRVYNLAGGWQAWESWQQARPGLSEPHRQWLLAQGFEPDKLNSRIDLGMSPLMLAALRGEHELVGALLAAGADPNMINDDHHHALWFACVNGDTALVRKMIDHGARIDNRNINGVTCAIYAASTGKLEVLRVLVEAGADLSIATDDGITALEGASTLPVLRFLKPLLRQAV